jgi:hypothetical protein
MLGSDSLEDRAIMPSVGEKEAQDFATLGAATQKLSYRPHLHVIGRSVPDLIHESQVLLHEYLVADLPDTGLWLLP